MPYLHVKISEDLDRALTDLSKKTGHPKAQIVRTVLNRHVETEKRREA